MHLGKMGHEIRETCLAGGGFVEQIRARRDRLNFSDQEARGEYIDGTGLEPVYP
jgi:hypothetical protein